MATAKTCPKCRQNAPIVVRGVEAYCTVCNARRTPFAADILNFAGEPARLGGYAARWFGWGAMGTGLFVAFALGLILQAVASLFFPGTWLGLAVALPIALLSVALGLVGIIGGKRLGRAGDNRRFAAQRDTIHALARHHNGVVTIRDAARSLGIDAARADAVLVALAREPAENVSLDLNEDDGTVRYFFGSVDAIRWRIQAERAGITEADREALERELAEAEKPEPGTEFRGG